MGLPAQSGLRGKITDSHAIRYGAYDRYWASAGVMNIDTTAINPASAIIFLAIPCLPFSPVPELPITLQHSSVSNHFSSSVNCPIRNILESAGAARDLRPALRHVGSYGHKSTHTNRLKKNNPEQPWT